MESFETKVEKLLQLLEGEEGNKVEALASLAAMSTFKPHDQGPVDALRRILRPCLALLDEDDQEACVRNSALVLGGLFDSKTLDMDPNTSVMCAETLVRALKKMHRKAETRAAIANAVSDFSQIDASMRELLYVEGAIEALVEVATKEADRRTLYAYGNALIVLSMDCSEGVERLVSSGGLGVYLQLTKSSDPTHRQVGLLGIGMSVGKDANHALEFISIPGSVKQVTASMKSVHPDEKQVANDIFYTLGGAPQCRDALLDSLR